MDQDPFLQNILGPTNLIASEINKTHTGDVGDDVGELIDDLELPMSDEELLKLRDEWQQLDSTYSPKIKPRQDANKIYYQGKQRTNGMSADRVVSSNLIFEAEETFIPQALSQNPEPVVWSDNTEQGKEDSNNIKTMLQYHADVLCLRKKLGVMVRHWSIYFTGIIKYGWDKKLNDITTEIRNPKNFLFDPDGYVDEYGNYVGAFLGERCNITAKKLIEQFGHREEITVKVDGKMGTPLVYTEWWTDEYCFSTFEDIVLDKHKNEFFDYSDEKKNHFAVPKMPYTLLSVFSLQEHPHDITNLIEQNIPNQDMINDRDLQITKNLRTGNNSLVLSMLHGWNTENARQGAQAIEDGDPILAPGEITEAAIRRLPSSALPNGVMESLQVDKDTLRSVFGTAGLTAQQQTEDQTARGMILNQSHDSTRIGGGIGDALEQVADNVFNWWLQLYNVFYDEPHFAAIIGNDKGVEHVMLQNTNMSRKFVVSVSPNSMTPKDEISEANQAIQLAEGGWLDPINLFKKLSYADPMKTAEAVTMFRINPQQYFQTYFPQATPQPGQQPPQGGQTPPEQGTSPGTLSQEPANASLNQVPLPK